MTNKTHRFPLRVYYEDTDAQKIVYYANYFRFMERARTEMMREAGVSHAAITQQDGQFFVVGEATARYKMSGILDDELVVESSLEHIGNASMKLRQNVLKRLGKAESLLVEGMITLIYVTDQGKPVRIPDKIRTVLQDYLKD